MFNFISNSNLDYKKIIQKYGMESDLNIEILKKFC